jgi:sugar phosphate permease
MDGILNCYSHLSNPASWRKRFERRLLVWRQVRWHVLSLLFLVTVINFIHRQTLSVVAPVIQDEFHLSNSAYGTIVAAFMFGMMVGEFPVG